MVLKTEIAKRYFPASNDPMSCLRRHLRVKGITARLETETVYNPFSRYFSKAQVRIIEDELGGVL